MTKEHCSAMTEIQFKGNSNGRFMLHKQALNSDSLVVQTEMMHMA